MTYMIKMPASVIASLIAATSLAYAAPADSLARRAHETRPGVPPNVSCIVQGNPSEFPHDIAITNRGPGMIANGVTIHWSIDDKSGDMTLASPLVAGKGFYVRGVLPEGAQAGTPCLASLQ